MKIHSLIWKTACAIGIGVICGTQPLVQRSIAQYSISSPTPPSPSASPSPSSIPDSQQPPIIFTPKGGLCDRITNTMCGGVPNVDNIIDKADKKATQDVCNYTQSCSATPSVTLSFVQDELQKSEQVTESTTALVYPIIFADRLELLFIPASGKEIRKVVRNTGKNEIDTTVLELLSEIRDPSSEDYLPAAQSLYNWIIRPIDSDLQAAQIKTLVFVMDGSLRSVPIGVLHDGKQFLVQKYAIATVPSMGLVNLRLRDRRRSNILAMGLTEKTERFSAIPNVGVELNTIASQILEGRVFLNKEFTIDNLIGQQKQNNYGIVHLATHAKFLSNTADGAFIQMWNERLSLARLRTIQIGQEPIEMLTLSACQTAVGQNLGLSGVAIIYNAKSVLASLWQVDDAGTTPLMLSFYRNFPTAKSKAIALQQTQIAMLTGNVRIEGQQILGIPNLSAVTLKQLTKDIDLKHPYFWASFILVGNWL